RTRATRRSKLPAVNGILPKELFDAQELIVLRDAISAAEGAGLDLPGVRRDGNVRNRGVFGFAGAMTDHGGVAVLLRQLDRVQRFSKRANLVHLHEDRIRDALIDALAQK